MMTDAILAVTRRWRTLADGTCRLELDIEPYHAEEAVRLLGTLPGISVALARLTEEAARDTLGASPPTSIHLSIPHAQKAPENAHNALDHPYGAQAKALRLSAFFRTSEVWRALGPDEDYLMWVRTLPCAVCHREGSEAAHVRRIADGAGTAIKPAYSAIPLCHEHHALQHQRGESAIGGREWVDQQRIRYVVAWGWATLKATLGYESMGDIPPPEIRAWAQQQCIEQHLPAEYRYA